MSGPVEQGQPPVMAMDLDRALGVITARLPGTGGPDYVLTDDEREATNALRTLVDRARQYVAGPTSGRLAALCQILQEPVPDRPEPVNVQTVVQAYLTERGLVTVSREIAAERLGITAPYA